MDKCEFLSDMRWTQSISIRQYERMSRERGFAEISLWLVSTLIQLYNRRMFHVKHFSVMQSFIFIHQHIGNDNAANEDCTYAQHGYHGNIIA